MSFRATYQRPHLRRRDLFGLAASALALPGRAETRTLRYGVSTYAGAAPFFTALEKGYFQTAGFEFDLVRNQSGVDLSIMLAGGRLDAIQVSITPAMLAAIAKGAPLKIVYAREQTSPNCEGFGWVRGLASSFPNGLKQLSELRGKKIAYGPNASIGEYALDRILELGGLDRSAVTPVNVRPFEALAALAAGGVDALVCQSGIDFRKFSRPLVVHRGFSAAATFQLSYVVFGKGVLDQPVATGARFLSAYQRGVADFRAGFSPKFFDELAMSSRTDAAFLRDACRDTVSPTGAVSLESLQRFIDWCRKRNYLEQPLNAADLVDTRFLRATQAGAP